MFYREAPLAALALFLTGCPGCAPAPAERLAILRFENLSGDPTLDWMGRALSESMIGSLTGSGRTWVIPFKTLHATGGAGSMRLLSAPGISTERTLALMAGANRILYGRYSLATGGFRVEASMEDPATGKRVRTVNATAAEVPQAAESLARQLAATARAPGTRNREAMREYAAALDTRDAPAAEAALERSVKADPDFGAAYLLLARSALERGDRTAATQTLQKARDHALAPIERARVEAELAAVRGDAAGRQRALAELARLTPADPEPYHGLASLATAAHRYPQAAGWLRRAAELAPGNIVVLNTLGYTEAYAGDLQAATVALREYERLRPREGNPLDSLGDVHVAMGRFAEAGRFYLEAWQRDPAFLGGGTVFKAAQVRAMAGDVAGADKLFEKYLEARRAAGDRLLEYRRAEWEWRTGRRRAALDRLGKFAAAATDPAGLTWGQLAMWRLTLGDEEGARAAAQKTQALLPRLLTARVPASEWAARADQLAGDRAGPQARDLALACGLLFARDFRSAAAPLERLYASWEPGSDPAVPVLLAWVYAEAGQLERAAPLLAFYPIPQPDPLNPLSSLWFPRFFFLRGLALNREGKSAEARRDWQTFLTLSGPDDDIWGQRRAAESALAR